MSRILISIILLMSMGFGGLKTPIPETIEEDGGVKRYNSGTDAPKTIESTEIISFECEFSLISVVLEEESELDGRVYTLNAVCENEAVTCKIKWYDRFGDGDTSEFTADTSFMTRLQEIVSKYNFAQHNGYICKVSGLPNQYGAMLNIQYDSGETIYANDNQNCFLSFEAMEDLARLFSKQ